ncbi:GIMA1 GTPase, partial [Alectura lathami]|nr:GIMA1 GTPase [Alectura lathami]
DSLQGYVESTGPAALRGLLRDCGGRCCLFNNRAVGAQRDAQVDELLTLVQKMLKEGPSPHYTNELYVEATRLLECVDTELEKKCELLS